MSPAPARRRGAAIALRHLDPEALTAHAVLAAAGAYPVPLVLPTGWHQRPRWAAAVWIYTGLGAEHRPDLLLPLSARPAEQWPRAAAQIEQDWVGNIGGLLLVRAARALLDPTFAAPAPAQLAVAPRRLPAAPARGRRRLRRPADAQRGRQLKRSFSPILQPALLAHRPSSASI